MNAPHLPHNEGVAGRASVEATGKRVRHIHHPPFSATPLGVYVLSFVLAVASLVCLLLFFSQRLVPRWFGALGAPLCLFLAVGLPLRISLARGLLIQMLSFAMVLEGILVLAAMFG